jgi:hypothetical protein
MKSTTVRLLLALLLLGLVVVVIQQRASLQQLRAEIERLRVQAAQVDPPRKEDQRSDRISLESDELERLRQEHLELVRLRGEVTSLRQGKGATKPGSLNATTAPGQPILITSQEGQQIVGDQLKQFTAEADGAISATKDSWISLNNTMGQGFILNGQVWLGGASNTLEFPEDTPDGFAIYIREWDGLHRYAVTTRYMQVKRRKWSAGLPGGEESIVHVTQFQDPPMGTWIPFMLEVTKERIAFRVGNQEGTIAGPLETDGANKIALAPGSKVKDVYLQTLPEPVGTE